MKTEDQPSEEIWLDDEALKEHFDMVRERYASNRPGGGEAVEDVPMTDNEATRMLRRR